MSLAKNIKTIREKWELTQTEFGLLIGASRGMIMQYETRGTIPKDETVSRMAETTGFSPTRLLEGEILREHIGPLDDVQLSYIETYRQNPKAFDKATRPEDLDSDNIEVEVVDYQKLYIEQLRKENERLAKVLDVNLTGLAWGQATILAHLSVSAEVEAEREAKGDPQKVEQLKQERGKRIADKIQAPK